MYYVPGRRENRDEINYNYVEIWWSNLVLRNEWRQVSHAVYREDVWCTKMPLSQDRLDNKLAEALIMDSVVPLDQIYIWSKVVPASAVSRMNGIRVVVLLLDHTHRRPLGAYLCVLTTITKINSTIHLKNKSTIKRYSKWLDIEWFYITKVSGC